jgi:hypothetical protein
MHVGIVDKPEVVRGVIARIAVSSNLDLSGFIQLNQGKAVFVLGLGL